MCNPGYECLECKYQKCINVSAKRTASELLMLVNAGVIPVRYYVQAIKKAAHRRQSVERKRKNIQLDYNTKGANEDVNCKRF